MATMVHSIERYEGMIASLEAIIAEQKASIAELHAKLATESSNTQESLFGYGPSGLTEGCRSDKGADDSATKHIKPYVRNSGSYPFETSCSLSQAPNSIGSASGNRFSMCAKYADIIIPVTSNSFYYYMSCGCENCTEKCKEMVKVEQEKPFYYGDVFHLRNKSIKIMRSKQTNPDEGWRILPGIEYNGTVGWINCTKTDSEGIVWEKKVTLSEILRLNP
jgi:hypothetical protein